MLPSTRKFRCYCTTFLTVTTSLESAICTFFWTSCSACLFAACLLASVAAETGQKPVTTSLGIPARLYTCVSMLACCTCGCNDNENGLQAPGRGTGGECMPLGGCDLCSHSSACLASAYMQIQLGDGGWIWRAYLLAYVVLNTYPHHMSGSR